MMELIINLTLGKSILKKMFTYLTYFYKRPKKITHLSQMLWTPNLLILDSKYSIISIFWSTYTYRTQPVDCTSNSHIKMIILLRKKKTSKVGRLLEQIDHIFLPPTMIHNDDIV